MLQSLQPQQCMAFGKLWRCARHKEAASAHTRVRVHLFVQWCRQGTVLQPQDDYQHGTNLGSSSQGWHICGSASDLC